MKRGGRRVRSAPPQYRRTSCGRLTRYARVCESVDGVTTSHEPTAAAIEALYADALEIYERARTEVTIERRDGSRQRYAATRYKQQIDKGYPEGLLVPVIARIIRRPTLGFGHLEAAGRPDLMLETLVLDAKRPYHGLFAPETVRIARARMSAYQAWHPRQG